MLGNFNHKYMVSPSQALELVGDINSVFRKQFSNAKPLFIGCHNPRMAKCHNFFMENITYCDNTYGVGANGILLPDGSFIFNVMTEPGLNGFAVMFDTNGPYKGPNAFQRDIFRFTIGQKIGSCHNIETMDRSNVTACYRYAQIDQNPNDSSLGYWESLYKPKSWWEKLQNQNNE